MNIEAGLSAALAAIIWQFLNNGVKSDAERFWIVVGYIIGAGIFAFLVPASVPWPYSMLLGVALPAGGLLGMIAGKIADKTTLGREATKRGY
jgi:hypothetical protein